MNSNEIIDKMMEAASAADPEKKYITPKNVAAMFEMGIRLHFQEMRMWLDERLRGLAAPAVEVPKPEASDKQCEFELQGYDKARTETSDAVSEALNLSVSSVYELAKQGFIPASKAGQHWRFNMEEVVMAVKSRFLVKRPYDGKLRWAYLHSVKVLKAEMQGKVFTRVSDFDKVKISGTVVRGWQEGGIPFYKLPALTGSRSSDKTPILFDIDEVIAFLGQKGGEA